MRTYKVAKKVFEEVSAEEAIAALRATFDEETTPSTSPFKVGDIVDVGQCRDSCGSPYTDDDGEPTILAYVLDVDDSDDTLQVGFIDSTGEADSSGVWVPWKHATLVDRKQR